MIKPGTVSDTIGVQAYMHRQRVEWSEFNKKWGEPTFSPEQIDQEIKDILRYNELKRLRIDSKK